MSEASPALYEFCWMDGTGKVTAVSCWARGRPEAEDAARRAGWPGHDGTRLGRYRAELERLMRIDDIS
ncbi:hypothetical protein [Niveispirillum fermenti]|uniref:hypothetical protein n=1 Tax=Niveispirillum fermenti TaxID=1233113 RepID=UPI003A894C83